MTVRDELVEVLSGRKSAQTGIALEITMVNFLRKHGPALVEAVRDAASRVVVTRDSTGEIVAVTRQDDDGRILKVIAEKFTEKQRLAHQLDHALTIIAIDQARAEGGE